jgi:hypothetical protein
MRARNENKVRSSIVSWLVMLLFFGGIWTAFVLRDFHNRRQRAELEESRRIQNERAKEDSQRFSKLFLALTTYQPGSAAVNAVGQRLLGPVPILRQPYPSIDPILNEVGRKLRPLDSIQSVSRPPHPGKLRARTAAAAGPGSTLRRAGPRCISGARGELKARSVPACRVT